MYFQFYSPINKLIFSNRKEFIFISLPSLFHSQILFAHKRTRISIFSLLDFICLQNGTSCHEGFSLFFLVDHIVPVLDTTFALHLLYCLMLDFLFYFFISLQHSLILYLFQHNDCLPYSSLLILMKFIQFFFIFNELTLFFMRLILLRD